MTIAKASLADMPAIISLLKANDLPVDDIAPGKQQFYIATNQSQIIGAIGLETYGPDALLRSLVVNEEWRNQSVGNALYNCLVSECTGHIRHLYLLTRTAQGYFEHRNWSVIDRNAAPEAIKASAEFSHLCPSSAVCMHLPLTKS